MDIMIRAPRIRNIPAAVLAGVLVVAGFALPGRALAQKGNDQLDRTVLPIPEPNYPPQHRARRPRRQGPAAFRGQGAGGRAQRAHRADRRYGLRPCRAPSAARSTCRPWNVSPTEGLRYNQFHTTALCSPTRTALLTGRNHHMNNMGVDHGDGHGVPGQHGTAARQRRPAGRDAAAERLQHRRFGKNHETAAWEVSPPGRPTAGRRVRASTSSTASSAARPTSGRPRSMTA